MQAIYFQDIESHIGSMNAGDNTYVNSLRSGIRRNDTLAESGKNVRHAVAPERNVPDHYAADGRAHTDSVLPSMVACHECDLLHRKRALDRGQVARCSRCNAFLYANKPNSIDRALAVSLAALIMFVVANAFPFLAISVSGNTQSISIISAVFALSDEGMWVLGLLSFGFILLIPLLRVVGLLYILLPLRFERRLPGIEIVFRGIVGLSPWSMMEIYMFGAIVALVKLASMANIELGLSFWAFAILNLLSVLAAQMVDNHSLWEFISHSRGGRHRFVSSEPSADDEQLC